jgi:hypothetical protein
MNVPAGVDAKLESRTVNQGGGATFEPINATVDATCGSGAITVVEDPADTALVRQGIIPPGRFLVSGGSTLGQTCVVLNGGGQTEQVDVTVLAENLQIVSAPALVRAGETGTVVAGLFDADGGELGPYDPADATWASDNTAIAEIDETGNFTTAETGNVLFTVTWSGQEANGTVISGYTLEAEHVMVVQADVPVAAAYDVGDNLGAFPVGETGEYEVIVTDALGNQNINPDDITGVTLDAVDAAVATATAELVETEVAGETFVNVFVEVTAVGGGQATVSGTVQTVSGDLPFTGVFSVVAPVITAITPALIQPGEPFTVTGTGLSLPGLTTSATYAGFPAVVEVVSDTEITVTPNHFCPGTFPVVVDLEGVTSNSFNQSQADAVWNADDYEAPPIDNNDAASGNEPRVCTSAGQTISGSVSPDDTDDFFRVTTGSGVTVTLTLDWDDAGNDIDIYVVDGGFTVFVCTDGGTLGKPEVSVCELDPDTDYLFWVEDFGPGVSNYTLEISP